MMQRAIINCQTKQVEYVEMSFEEEVKRFEEIEAEQKRQEKEQKASLKKRLATALVELREMGAEPIFDADDIAAKEAEVLELRQKLAELKKP